MHMVPTAREYEINESRPKAQEKRKRDTYMYVVRVELKTPSTLPDLDYK